MPHLVSGINSPTLSDNFVPVSLSLTPFFLCKDYPTNRRFTTLTIHISLSLSLPAQKTPLSQVLPTINTLSSTRTDSIRSTCGFSFVFSSFSVIFFQLSGSVRYSSVRASYFSVRVINVWNSLPADRVDFSSFAAFKQTI